MVNRTYFCDCGAADIVQERTLFLREYATYQNIATGCLLRRKNCDSFFWLRYMTNNSNKNLHYNTPDVAEYTTSCTECGGVRIGRSFGALPKLRLLAP
jgi:hypothetical protein